MTLVPDNEFHPQLHSELMRPEQVDAYRAIKENGLLSELRMRVYEIIYAHQTTGTGVTSGEIDRIMSTDAGIWTRSASPRLSELVRLGVIEELPQRRICRRTGMTVIAYQTTPCLPNNNTLLKKQRQPSTAQLMDALATAHDLLREALSWDRHRFQATSKEIADWTTRAKKETGDV